jgi:hypothetical protein
MQDLFARAENLCVTTLVLLVFTGLPTMVLLFACALADPYRDRNS